MIIFGLNLRRAGGGYLVSLALEEINERQRTAPLIISGYICMVHQDTYVCTTYIDSGNARMSMYDGQYAFG